MKYNPLLLIDFYKSTHAEQYPEDVTKIVSYYTPRMSRLPGQDKVIFFGMQGFIQEYLEEVFHENFFNMPLEFVLQEYRTVLDATLGEGAYSYEKIENLHRLGYLPIEIKALPEGSRVDVKVPMFEISNTHPDFAWVTNTLETLISCTMWHTMQSANVGYNYRQIVNNYYKKTVDNLDPKRALGDFSLRGQESIESGIKSSAAWLLSFMNTATVPAIMWLNSYYKTGNENLKPMELKEIGSGAISTEHSVMCSNFAVDGDEITHVKRLLTEIYPKHSFSMVSDSYDYWNLVENILPQCKEEIMAHEGYIGIRGDSGDPVEVVTQTVFKLWDIFGGTTNSKGYKVLDPHVKAIYGDSITPQRCEAVYKILTEAGFACNNVTLGVGSFSMQCLEEDGQLLPYTRDTFGVAIKATYCETKDGKEIPVFKNPKEGGFKVSQKGCCVVYETADGFDYYDGKNFKETYVPQNELKTVWKDGKFVRKQSLEDIREVLHGEGNF